MKLTDIKDPKKRKRFHDAINHPAHIGLPDTQPRERQEKLESHREREAQGPGCPLVRFKLRRVRLLDVDAKYASVKDLLDGLANAGLIHGDKEGQIRLEVEQEKVCAYLKEMTIIEIIYP